MIASTAADSTYRRLRAGRHHDPRALLGRHVDAETCRVAVWLPRARDVRIDGGPALARKGRDGLFEWIGAAADVPHHYRIVWHDDVGTAHREFDPYTFDAPLGAHDLYLFNEGTHRRLYDVLGAQWTVVDGIAGVRFAVWAPNAEGVAVVGDWNDWDDRRQPLGAQGSSGLWTLFVPELAAGACYKFAVRPHGADVVLKADPFARAFERPPRTASRLISPTSHSWCDAAWLAARTDAPPRPMSIYEVHLGSWRRAPDGSALGYRALAEQLADYADELGFTHVELMPIAEHPFGGSWGYQTLGYFAPTSRFGEPDDFRAFVDHLHQRGIGVILDWVPAHFPRDPHGLARFDGTALYEHADPRLGEHKDWDTLIFNYGRNEVRAFLLANALFWLAEMHVDGLRVDAVASMLYLDYSRQPGEWLPNRFGGRENLDAIALLRALSDAVAEDVPGAFLVAEESTAWPGVTGATTAGGLGFTFKWNMGWMHDTLDYMQRDPVHRAYHHDRLTFGMLYTYSERFVLPFSHDEVVHGKGSLLGKMPGDDWQKFANLRLLLAYQWTYPGKKLLFMGGELAQWREWDHDACLDWNLLQYDRHAGVQRLVKDLNRLYRSEAAFGEDHDARGFEWIDCADRDQSVVAYLRRAHGREVVVVLNFTPVVRHHYRIGVPAAGRYVELLNSDSTFYGGSNQGNHGVSATRAIATMGRPCALEITLPPLATLVLQRVDA
jgi:1,4-alpha-glucan branching enzyme